MSINNRLQSMLSCDESGEFLTKEKQEELKTINEAFFSQLGHLGGDLMGLAKAVTSKMMKVTSAAGKGIMTALEKMDIENFKKKFDIKKIQDLDAKLSLLKVNNPELFAIMKTLMLSMVKVKKSNPELYKKANPIFEKHINRMISYYNTLINNSKDPDQIQMYLGILTDMLQWVDKDSDEREKITGIMAGIKDIEALKDAGIDMERLASGKLKQAKKVIKKQGKEPPPVQEIQKVAHGKTYTSMTKEDIAKLDIASLERAIKLFENYLAAFVEIDAGTKIEGGMKMIDMKMMDAYLNVKENLQFAKKKMRTAKPTTTKPQPAAEKPAAPSA